MEVTVTVPISGVELDSTIESIETGRLVIYKNPALPPQPWPQFPGPNGHLVTDPDSPGRPVARFLAQFLFESDDGGVRCDHVIREGERLLLPIRLRTRARILLPELPDLIVTGHEITMPPWLIRAGNHLDTRPGCPWAALSPFDGLVSTQLSREEAATLADYCQRLQPIDLFMYEVPIGLFVESFYRPRAVDRGLNLVVATEALFSEGAESIAYKVALRVSCSLETSGEKRRALFDLVKTAYSHRNALVHGSTKKRPSASTWFSEHLTELEDVVRRGLDFVIQGLVAGKPILPDALDDYLFSSGLLSARTRLPTQRIEYLGSNFEVMRFI